MNKSEAREVAKLDAIARIVHVEPSYVAYLARGYSSLIRAARTTKSRNEIITAAAYVPAVVQHPDFII